MDTQYGYGYLTFFDPKPIDVLGDAAPARIRDANTAMIVEQRLENVVERLPLVKPTKERIIIGLVLITLIVATIYAFSWAWTKINL